MHEGHTFEFRAIILTQRLGATKTLTFTGRKTLDEFSMRLCGTINFGKIQRGRPRPFIL